MSEIQVHDPQAVTFLPDTNVAARVWGLAERIAKTDFVPSSLRGKPEAIMAAMLTGREVGIGAMHSLRAIDVIDGRPSLSPELLHALALKAGHDLDVIESTRSTCTVEVRRSEWPDDRVRTVTFDEVDARLAGLVGESCKPAEGVHDEREVTKQGRNGTYTKVECGCRQGYRTYPRAMYRARAIAEACRSHLPDVVERIGYTAEEMGGDPTPHAEAMEVVRDVAPDVADDVAVDDDDPDDDGGTIVDAEVVPDDDPDDAADTPDDPAPSGEAETGDDGSDDTPAARAHARTLEAVYDSLNVGQVADVIRTGSVTVDGVTYTGSPHDVWNLERTRDRFRKTVKATLEGVGYYNSDTPDVADDDEGATSGPETAPDSPAGGDGTTDAPADVSRDPGALDRREALREYNRLYREVYETDPSAAASVHAARLERLGSDQPDAFRDADEDAVVAVLAHARSVHADVVVPF